MLNFEDERERGKKHVTGQYLEACHLGKSVCIMFVCICRNHFCKETPRAGNWAPGRKTKAERQESRETHFLLCIECCNMLTKHIFKINNKVRRKQYRGTCSS